MKNWVLRLPIKYKLLIAFGSILLLSVFLMTAGIRNINAIISYNELVEQLDRVHISTLKMAGNVQTFTERGYKEEHFLKAGESEWLVNYHTNMEQAKAILTEIEDHEILNDKVNANAFKTITSSLHAFDQSIKSLLVVYAERGFKDYGIEGKLRNAIHNVEQSDFPYDRVSMLMLRRHEKDFFLRKDMKYLDRFNAEIEKLRHEVTLADSVWGQQEILNYLDAYKEQFNYIVSLEEQIGLDVSSGLAGTLNQQSANLQNAINTLNELAISKKQEIVASSFIQLTVLVIAQLAIGFVLVVFYAKLLTKAINEIKRSLVTLSQGSFPDTLPIRTKDEIADAKNALNNLVQRIRTAANFAQDLGKGNLKIDYDERYRDDVLAKAIITMKEQLVIADNQQRAINWRNEGMARFSEILKNESEDIAILGDQIIAQLVNYLGANQGALYLMNEANNTLIRTATYAYSKKKYQDHEIAIGQGLVGQSVLEKAFIHVTDVPHDYINITSGLGEATASNILIVPLLKGDEVLGVIELASFNTITDLNIEFVTGLSESIAAILKNKRAVANTEALLAEAQKKAEQMASQEEELKQNTEELMSTQEDMDRQKRELNAQIDELLYNIAQKDIEIERMTRQLMQASRTKAKMHA